MTLPDRWLTLWWNDSEGLSSASLNADQEGPLHDGVSAYINQGRTRDWLITLSLTSGGIVTLPVSAIQYWNEMTPLALEQAFREEALCEQMGNEQRKSILGPDWSE